MRQTSLASGHPPCLLPASDHANLHARRPPCPSCPDASSCVNSPQYRSRGWPAPSPRYHNRTGRACSDGSAAFPSRLHLSTHMEFRRELIPDLSELAMPSSRPCAAPEIRYYTRAILSARGILPESQAQNVRGVCAREKGLLVPGGGVEFDLDIVRRRPAQQRTRTASPTLPPSHPVISPGLPQAAPRLELARFARP